MTNTTLTSEQNKDNLILILMAPGVDDFHVVLMGIWLSYSVFMDSRPVTRGTSEMLVMRQKERLNELVHFARANSRFYAGKFGAVLLESSL